VIFDDYRLLQVNFSIFKLTMIIYAFQLEKQTTKEEPTIDATMFRSYDQLKEELKDLKLEV